MTAKDIFREISDISVWLTRCSLSDSYNSPLCEEKGGLCIIGFSGSENISVCLNKTLAYKDIFAKLDECRAYSCKMLDGALLQMSYIFRKDELVKHRLAFFSSPDHTPFQSDPKLYQEEVLFADVISKNIVPFPIRFDYDEKLVKVADHPLSHLTLGQYEGCRIPVTAPLTPCQFVGFILSSFYNRALDTITTKTAFPHSKVLFRNTIRAAESKMFHFCLG